MPARSECYSVNGYRVLFPCEERSANTGPEHVRFGIYRQAVIGALICFLTLLSPAAALDWTIETVESRGDAGYFSSLALSGRGEGRICYWDWTEGRLMYTEQCGEAWSGEPVVETGMPGEFCSLRLDGAGEPFVSFYTQPAGNLSLASRSGGRWTVSTVDSGGVGRYPSLALDRGGDPRIAYQDLGNMSLKYAEMRGDSWSLATVDNSGNAGAYASLVLDPDGNPSISYYDGLRGSLKYATKSGSNWTLSTVDSTGNTGYYTSLALGPDREPGISYYDGSARDLKFAVRTGGTWRKEIVDSAGSVGKYTSLSFDARGDPHISYFDETNGHLKYATKNGSIWTIETVDRSQAAGLFTSLALDPDGNPGISYRDGTKGDLLYARGVPHLELDFIAMPQEGPAPLDVRFLDHSTGGRVVSWNWSFGDGAWFNTTSTDLKNASHIYATPGSYTVTLYARNFFVQERLERSGYITVAERVLTPVTTVIPTVPVPTGTGTPPEETPPADPTLPPLTPTPVPSPPTPTTVPSSPTPEVSPSGPVPSYPAPYGDSGDDHPSLTPVPAHPGSLMTQTVNVGGDSAVRRVVVTGRDVADIIVVAKRDPDVPGRGCPSVAPVYQYGDLASAHYGVIEAVEIDFEVSPSFFRQSGSEPDQVVLSVCRNQSWYPLPTRFRGIHDGQACYTAAGTELSAFAIVPGNRPDPLPDERASAPPALTTPVPSPVTGSGDLPRQNVSYPGPAHPEKTRNPALSPIIPAAVSAFIGAAVVIFGLRVRPG